MRMRVGSGLTTGVGAALGCAGGTEASDVGAGVEAEKTVGSVAAPGGGAITEGGSGFLHESTRSAGGGGAGVALEATAAAAPLTGAGGLFASSAILNFSSNSSAFFLALAFCSSLACSSSCLRFLALSAAACISRR